MANFSRLWSASDWERLRRAFRDAAMFRLARAAAEHRQVVAWRQVAAEGGDFERDALVWAAHVARETHLAAARAARDEIRQAERRAARYRRALERPTMGTLNPFRYWPSPDLPEPARRAVIRKLLSGRAGPAPPSSHRPL